MFRLNIDEAGRFALPGFSFVETTLSSALSDHATSLPPEILEPIRRQGRVHRRARVRTVPQPFLNRPGVVNLCWRGHSRRRVT